MNQKSRRIGIAGSSGILLLAMLAGCSGPERPIPANESEEPAMKLLQFYASPGTITRGQETRLCYGLENAKEVRLDPPVEKITPSLNRCISVSPSESTTYTLFAGDGQGREISQEVTVTVDARPGGTPAPQDVTLIRFFTASSTSVQAGRPFTVCYGVKDAVKVELSPPIQAIQPSERACFNTSVQRTTEFTLTATSDSGALDHESLTIEVN